MAPDKDVQFGDLENGVLVVESPFNGEVLNHMDVSRFPFDEDSLTMRFNGQMRRDGTPTQSQSLVPPVPEFHFTAQTDQPVTLLFDDSMPEFMLIGEWHAIETKANGSCFHLGIVLRRRWLFYFWNVILLQWIIMCLTFCCVPMHPADDLESRMGLVVTMYLVGTATLYAVSDYLPHTHKPAFLGNLIVISSLFIFAIALETAVIASAVKVGADSDSARRADLIFLASLFLIYIIFNITTMVPALKHYWNPSSQNQPFEGTVPQNMLLLPTYAFSGLKNPRIHLRLFRSQIS